MSETKKANAGSLGITKEQFIKAWEASSSPADAAKRLARFANREVTPTTASSRAAYYRSRGDTLKSFPRGRKAAVEA